MLRLAVRTLLAGAMLCASLTAISTAIAQDCCPSCRGAKLGGRGYLNNVMGSVAYQDRAEHGEGYAGNGYGTNCGPGGCRDRAYPQPDLFYNYYVPGNCGGYPAQMYLSPRPVPAHVGHTYITYQPFMPHEYMYKHSRTYHQYYDGGRGLTRTKAIWW